MVTTKVFTTDYAQTVFFSLRIKVYVQMTLWSVRSVCYIPSYRWERKCYNIWKLLISVYTKKFASKCRNINHIKMPLV